MAVRIPKAFAVHLGIDAGKEVELSLESHSLKISSVEQDLHALLSCVTPENTHGEVRTGSSIGREIW